MPVAAQLVLKLIAGMCLSELTLIRNSLTLYPKKHCCWDVDQILSDLLPFEFAVEPRSGPNPLLLFGCLPNSTFYCSSARGKTNRSLPNDSSSQMDRGGMFCGNDPLVQISPF